MMGSKCSKVRTTSLYVCCCWRGLKVCSSSLSAAQALEVTATLRSICFESVALRNGCVTLGDGLVALCQGGGQLRVDVCDAQLVATVDAHGGSGAHPLDGL
jgi:hypothetical protein